MDHWGDPWADDADTKSPAKSTEVKTPPPTQTSAPVLLNGFLDDAGWGAATEEDDFGGWASSTKVEDEGNEVPDTRLEDGALTAIAQEQLDSNGYNSTKDESNFDLIDEGWGRIEDAQDLSREPDNVVSEASDSATTIQPDENGDRISTDFSDAPRLDDEFSTRSSTSPSDISHTEAPTESPRTSFEDERNADNNNEARARSIHGDSESGKGKTEDIVLDTKATGASDSDGFGEFEDDDESESETPAVANATDLDPSSHPLKDVENKDVIFGRDDFHKPPTSTNSVAVAVAGLDGNSTFLTQLFPPTKASEGFTEAPEDPIHSTSTRKAWYRLTRKQTMREFNSGGDENSYVRVTWANSRIRTDVSKIVSRWANEDRNSGRGPGSRASFFWDQSAKAEQLPPVAHFQKKSTISSTVSSKQPTNKHAQPLATDVPAAFEWSSPSPETQDPWKQDSGGVRAVSSPLAAQSVSVSKAKSQEKRPVSMNLTSTHDVPATHKKTVSLISPIPPVLPLPTSTPAIDSIVSSDFTDSWDDLGGSHTNKTAIPTATAIEDDDDDDWGEMVQSPTIATPAPAEFPPPNASRDATPSSPATTPKPVKSLISQSTPPKHASPIVRLKGTVSPTSAIFGPTNYVPASSEQGPIGPGLLKPAKKNSPGNSSAISPSVSSMDDVLNAKLDGSTPNPDDMEDSSAFERSSTPQHAAEPNDGDDFSAFESSAPERSATLADSVPSTPPNTTGSLTHHSMDPWADADFSFFESSAAPAALASSNPLSPSDPFFVFETPAPAPTPFTRTPPRPKTPPPQMPLTGATNAAQRRKSEEDEIIRNIVQGLPDLGYMLAR